MRGTSTSQIRAPFFSAGAYDSAVVAGASMLASIGAIEVHGSTRYALFAASAVLAIVGIRKAWRVAQRETERLR